MVKKSKKPIIISAAVVIVLAAVIILAVNFTGKSDTVVGFGGAIGNTFYYIRDDILYSYNETDGEKQTDKGKISWLTEEEGSIYYGKSDKTYMISQEGGVSSEVTDADLARKVKAKAETDEVSEGIKAKDDGRYNIEIPDGYELEGCMAELDRKIISWVTRYDDNNEKCSYIMVTDEDGTSSVLEDYYSRDALYQTHDDCAVYFWAEQDNMMYLYAYLPASGEVRKMSDYTDYGDASDLYGLGTPCVLSYISGEDMYLSNERKSDIVKYTITRDEEGCPVSLEFKSLVYEYAG